MHNRDLADPRHARSSLRGSLDRRLRRARRARVSRGGRRALWTASLLLLCVGATGAFALSRDEVVAVQEQVGVVADGVMGPKTKAAIKRFQRRSGLEPDGVVGPQTLKAMGITADAAPTGLTAAPQSSPSGRLERIAECESGGDPAAVSRGGTYRGKYQFSRATWRALGGTGDPAAAPEAEQDRLAALLLERQGPGAWPSCA